MNITFQKTHQRAFGTFPLKGDVLRQAVRDAVLIAQEKMFTEGLAPAKAIAEAKRGADAAMLEYNQRVGG